MLKCLANVEEEEVLWKGYNEALDSLSKINAVRFTDWYPMVQ